MTKPTVTEQMVEAAWKIYAAAPVENGWKAAMRAAITAAIEASGLVEENARLREALDQIACAKRVSLDGVVVFESSSEFAERLQEIAEKALQPTIFGFPIVIDPTVEGFEFRNKDTTNDQ